MSVKAPLPKTNGSELASVGKGTVTVKCLNSISMTL